jgi:N-acetylglucosaminyldiphosphoundecaprenol N-acetyl-beta-D-mannosaminyltransferase
MLLGRLSVDRVTLAQALARITRLVELREGGMVLTPNVDHVVLAEEDDAFRRAYAAADLSLADGMPVVWASHLLGVPVPEKISGSDLVAPLLDVAAAKGWRVYLLGGGSGVAAKAARALTLRHPRLRIVGTSGPMLNLERPVAERQFAVDAVGAKTPDLVLVGFGAPKQELWMHESADRLGSAVLIGVGASLDFAAGTATRAPRWMSRLGLEWLYRLAREPRRMWRRYLVRDPKFIGIVARALYARWSRSSRPEALLPP